MFDIRIARVLVSEMDDVTYYAMSGDVDSLRAALDKGSNKGARDKVNIHIPACRAYDTCILYSMILTNPSQRLIMYDAMASTIQQPYYVVVLHILVAHDKTSYIY